MILSTQVKVTRHNEQPEYKYRLTRYANTIDELEFALVQFRNDPNWDCCIRTRVGKFAVFTKGDRIVKDPNNYKEESNGEDDE